MNHARPWGHAALLVGLLCGALTLTMSASPSRADADAETAGVSAALVNINTASSAELQRLPGVGPSRAQAIIAQRERRPFRRIEEIMRVKGIGRATFRELRPRLTVEGPPGAR